MGPYPGEIIDNGWHSASADGSSSSGTVDVDVSEQSSNTRYSRVHFATGERIVLVRFMDQLMVPTEGYFVEDVPDLVSQLVSCFREIAERIFEGKFTRRRISSGQVSRLWDMIILACTIFTL